MIQAYKIIDLARKLGVSRGTVYNLAKEGEIVPVAFERCKKKKIRRVLKSDLHNETGNVRYIDNCSR